MATIIAAVIMRGASSALPSSLVHIYSGELLLSAIVTAALVKLPTSRFEEIHFLDCEAPWPLLVSVT